MDHKETQDDAFMKVLCAVAEAPAVLPRFQRGSMVDHFRVIRLIGQGGMAMVYQARDTKLGRKVALKVVRPRALGSKEAQERFLFEARATARFNHPNITTIHAVGEHQGQLYVALEYLEGQTLRERMNQERLGTRETLRIGLSIAMAIQEAHRNGILHRDLKPENVILATDGRLRVLDFGLAKAFLLPEEDTEEAPLQARPTNMSRPSSWSGSTGICGTPEYMAPEQWRSDKATGAIDVWALGTILFELELGVHPYGKISVAERSRRVCERAPVTMPAEEQRAAPELLELICDCLLKDPDERPAMEGVAERIQDLLGQDLPLKATEGPFRGLLPFDERHSHFFYGREAEIAFFVERLRSEPILPVVGPSGAGKSSFVQAGVIPRILEQGRAVVLMLRPGHQPFQNLAARLLSVRTHRSTQAVGITAGVSLDTQGAGAWAQTVEELESPEEAEEAFDGEDHSEVNSLARRLRDTPQLLNLELHRLAERRSRKVILLVDQLEELYTLVPDGDVRRRFMEAIGTAVDDAMMPVRVIVTLREEFLGRLAQGPRAGMAFSQITVLRSPDAAALIEIFVRPVEAVGYTFDDPDLVPQMVAEVAGEDSCLPLLQFAGRMLWDHRDRENKLLTRAAYEAIGGVAGALARHADGTLTGLSASAVQIARTLFLRLVTSQGTRRALDRSRALEGLPDTAEDVLGRLTRARLITARRSEVEGEARLELVHESLVQTWGRLRRWIEESREELAFLAEISQTAELWQSRGRRAEEVWRGEALWDARRTMERCTTEVPEQVVQFLQAGQQQERQIQRRKRVRLAAGFVLLAVIALGSVLFTITLSSQKRDLEKQRAEALLEGARRALTYNAPLEARAKLRASLEARDSVMARALWWRLRDDPQRWSLDLGATVFDSALSPDGKTAAGSTKSGTIHLLDTDTLRHRVLSGFRGHLAALTFSPDSRRLAATYSSGAVRLWDVGAGVAETLARPGDMPAGLNDATQEAVAFSPDGKLLATGGNDRAVRLWDLRRGETIRTLRGHSGIVFDVVFSPDGKRVASASADRTARIWSVAGGGRPVLITGHTGALRALAFSPDGQLLATGSKDRTIRLWNVSTGEEVRRFQCLYRSNTGLAFLAAGKILVSSSYDMIILWDVASGKQLRTLRGHKYGIHRISVSRDGAKLLTGSSDKTLRLWDLTVEREERQPAGHVGDVFSATIGPGQQIVASGGRDHTVRKWDIATGAQLSLGRAHTQPILSVIFDGQGNTISGGVDGVYHSVIREQKKPRPTRMIFSGAVVYDLALGPGGELLAIAGNGGALRLQDRATNTTRLTLSGHKSVVHRAAFSRDGRYLASGDRRGKILLHDARTGAEIWQVSTGATSNSDPGAHFGLISGLAFTTDAVLLSTGVDGTLRTWNLTSRQGVRLRKFDSGIRALATDLERGRLAVALNSGEAHVLDLKGHTLARLRGHRGRINDVKFSRSGKHMVTGGADGSVRLWNSKNGMPAWRCPVLLPSPPRAVIHTRWLKLDSNGSKWTSNTAWSAALVARARTASSSHDGRWLCLATHDETLEIWDLEKDRRLRVDATAGIQDVLALAGGCVSLAGDTARLHGVTGVPRRLASRATAITLSRDKILVAHEKRISEFSPGGRQNMTHTVGTGVSAILQVRGGLLLGFSDGIIAAHTRDLAGKPVKSLLEQTPPSRVTRLVKGPSGTVIAGFSSGEVGIWNTEDQSRLNLARLHGPVTHLLVENEKLHAVTELGQHLSWDLSIFSTRYETLKKIVRQKVPVVWEDGAPVVNHR